MRHFARTAIGILDPPILRQIHLVPFLSYPTLKTADMPAPAGAALGAVSAYGSQKWMAAMGHLTWLIIEESSNG